VGLSELVTHSLEEYDALALKLGRDPNLLGHYRTRLAENRTTAPLFDTARCRRHVEATYTEIWRTWESSEPPRAFSVEPNLERMLGLLVEQHADRKIGLAAPWDVRHLEFPFEGHDLAMEGRRTSGCRDGTFSTSYRQ